MGVNITVEVDISDAEIALEFANTADWHASENPIERLNAYEDLVSWAERKGLVGAERAELLRAKGRKDPEQARDVHRRAIQLRETIYRIMSSYAGGGTAEPADVALLNEWLGRTMAGLRLQPGAGGFVMGWEDDLDLGLMLRPVVRSAARLLTTDRLLERVGQCDDDRGCGLLYLDLSKNRSRRWCDINDCGNRAKQRRHYLRHRHKDD